MRDRRELQKLIAQEEARLASLQDELRRCPAQDSELSTALPIEQKLVATLSNKDKVQLFRSLFRGREDLFPRRWENVKTGKSGYAPACRNEWLPGVCAKVRTGSGRKVKNVCGECRNQGFLSVTDEEVARHLKGLQVMGVYPLLADETCWFLAADFDGKDWQGDIAAFTETCTSNGLSVGVERSRSGNGGHAWCFFSEPVPATVARNMGCFLITEAMALRHQISMQSYDRLFPNQDTMPRGGFGNLIALPLQREARLRGNAVFLDANFSPFSNQWEYLAAIKRIDPALVQAIAKEADLRGRIIGVRASRYSVEEEKHEPWNRTSGELHQQVTIPGPFPPLVRVVISQRLFIEKAGLPSPLLDQIKRLASFQNPEFYKKQRMRLSTALTPRVISCFEDLADFIALPRGCLSDVEILFHDHGIPLSIEDKREEGTPLGVTFHGHLTSEQEHAVQTLRSHDMGILVAPPGAGKTVAGVSLIAARGRSTLILVHRKPLLDQWTAQLALFLEISPKDIGQIGAGKHRPNGGLDVAMIQSLVRAGQVDSLVTKYGHVLVDECHHVSAVSFERVLSEVKARYVTGLTATPQRRDGQEPIIHMQLGPVRFVAQARGQAVSASFSHKLFVRETGFDPLIVPEGASIQEIYALLSKNQWRNDLIFDDVVAALETGRSPILLTERRDHLEHFAERLRKFARHLIVLHGGMKTKERMEALARCMDIPDKEERLLLATGRFLGEGFDDARLDTLFLALPVSWKGTLVQYTGRLHRNHADKTEVRVYDYLDEKVPVLRKMFERRLRGYRAIGYQLAMADSTSGSHQSGAVVIGEQENDHAE